MYIHISFLHPIKVPNPFQHMLLYFCHFILFHATSFRIRVFLCDRSHKQNSQNHTCYKSLIKRSLFIPQFNESSQNILSTQVLISNVRNTSVFSLYFFIPKRLLCPLYCLKLRIYFTWKLKPSVLTLMIGPKGALSKNVSVSL